MTAEITIALGTDEYRITLGESTAVIGKDQGTSEMIARAIKRVRSDYSPAYGGVASFIAKEMENEIGASVVNVTELESVPNAVY